MSLPSGVPPKGPLPPEEAVRIALQMADALQRDHQQVPLLSDPRADIHAFGGTLYELLMGRPPGPGRRAIQPAALEAVLQKCLAENPAERFQSATDLKTALAGVFTARAFRREYAFVIASVVMLVGGLALLTMEFPRNQRLTAQDVLVPSDFNNATGDQIFDDTLRTALTLQLQRSPFLKVLDDQQMQRDLKLMGRPADARITPAIAHDICVREGQKAMLGGSIADLGQAFSITIQVVNCKSGITLAREQVQAVGRDQVLSAISQAAVGLRAKLGEPAGSIQTVSVPSIEALRAYALGAAQISRGNVAASAPLFQQATELDPDFALAYLQLSSVSAGLGDPQRAAEYAAKAYASYLRTDRLDEAVAAAKKSDTPAAHRALLRVAYMQSDEVAAAKEIAWFAGKPEEYQSLGEQSQDALLHGEFKKAAALAQQGARIAQQHDLPAAAGKLLAQVAGMGEFRGSCDAVEKIGAVAALLCSQAEGPLQDAEMAILKNQPAAAIAALQSAAPDERVNAQVSYLRGIAYLLLRKGPAAAGEFQKITDHKGASWGVVYPMAYLGAGRAWALSNSRADDSAKAKQAYEAFLTLWKDADTDLPVLAQAKREYAGL